MHKEFCQACVMNENGNILSNERIPSTVEDLARFLDRFEDTSFVLESTGI